MSTACFVIAIGLAGGLAAVAFVLLAPIRGQLERRRP